MFGRDLRCRILVETREACSQAVFATSCWESLGTVNIFMTVVGDKLAGSGSILGSALTHCPSIGQLVHCCEIVSAVK